MRWRLRALAWLVVAAAWLPAPNSRAVIAPMLHRPWAIVALSLSNTDRHSANTVRRSP